MCDNIIELEEGQYGKRWLVCEGTPEPLFTENETNACRLYGYDGGSRFAKDGINHYLVYGAADAVNEARVGTKASALYKLTIGPGETTSIRLRLTNTQRETAKLLGWPFDRVFGDRQREADEFYGAIISQNLSEDARNVMRQPATAAVVKSTFLVIPEAARDH